MDFVRSYFGTNEPLIWKKREEKSVQLVRGSNLILTKVTSYKIHILVTPDRFEIDVLMTWALYKSFLTSRRIDQIQLYQEETAVLRNWWNSKNFENFENFENEIVLFTVVCWLCCFLEYSVSRACSINLNGKIHRGITKPLFSFTGVLYWDFQYSTQ